MRSSFAAIAVALALTVPATAAASPADVAAGPAAAGPATEPAPPAAEPASPATPAAGAPESVIVTLRGSQRADRSDDPAAVRASRRRTRSDARSLGVTASAVYPRLGRVFSTLVTPAQRDRLERDPRVLAVESDDAVVDADVLDPLPADGLETEATLELAAAVEITRDVEADGRRSKVRGHPTRETVRRQVLPVWLKRVGVTRTEWGVGNGKTTRRFDADVAVIDSGISRKHPDVTPAGGKDCSNSGGWGDGYGHGTGVASILGAKDDRKGIVGMLPGVRLWSVRIFDDRGRGNVSGVLCALDWMAGKKDPRHKHEPFFEGATMSFAVTMRGRSPSTRPCGQGPRDSIHAGVCRLVRQGTILVAAAGNYGDSAKLRAPAAYPEVITVSAMADFDGRPGGRGRQSQACLPGSSIEQDDAFTTFSSYGSAVDLIAPGKCIWVAYKGGTYARVAGTSFSTPIVLAAALRYQQRYPGAKPNQVRMALVRAGRKDWRTGTDPDRRHEPRVDVRHFRAPPTFEYRTVKLKRLRREGDGVTVTLDRERRNGHTAPIELRKIYVPKGVKVSIDGSKVRLRASSSASTGSHHVTIRATDGEVSRKIRIPIHVRRR